MRLNHLDVPVPDTDLVARFFERHFGMRRIFERADGLIVLLDEADFALTLSPQRRAEALPHGFHVGFNVAHEDIVTGIYEQLGGLNVPIQRALGTISGALSFQCLAPGGLVVEMAWRQP
jgi:catechol 2,3-dioxygenase-like lactoylglutathione lyase family enzyme